MPDTFDMAGYDKTMHGYTKLREVEKNGILYQAWVKDSCKKCYGRGVSGVLDGGTPLMCKCVKRKVIPKQNLPGDIVDLLAASPEAEQVSAETEQQVPAGTGG